MRPSNEVIKISKGTANHLAQMAAAALASLVTNA